MHARQTLSLNYISPFYIFLNFEMGSCQVAQAGVKPEIFLCSWNYRGLTVVSLGNSLENSLTCLQGGLSRGVVHLNAY